MSTPSFDFRTANHGSVSIYFALLVLPLILISGLAIDLGAIEGRRVRLEQAVDAALIAALNGNVSEERRREFAEAAFRSNLSPGDIGHMKFLNFAFDTNTTGLTGTATYEAKSPVVFGQLVGISSLPIKGTASASTAAGGLVDVEFWIDVSASMGIGYEKRDRDRLRALSASDMGFFETKNCVFACHVYPVADGKTPYDRAIENGVRLRFTEMKKMIANVINRLAERSATVRFSIATIGDTFEYRIRDTTNVATVTTLVEGLSMQGTKEQYDLFVKNRKKAGSDTFKEAADRGSLLTKALRTGSTKVRQPDDPRDKRMVIVLTDGMEFNWDDTPAYGLYGRGRIDPSVCQPMWKEKNITVAVLDLPYADPNEDDGVRSRLREWQIADKEISSGLAECASPGFYSSNADLAVIEQAISGSLARVFGKPVLTR